MLVMVDHHLKRISIDTPTVAMMIQVIQVYVTKFVTEPVHEISNNVAYATSKASDQPAHTRSLIRAFASRLSIQRLLSYLLNTIQSL